MRICIDLTSLYDNFSGIERYAASIAASMLNNNNDVFILLFKNEIHTWFKKYISYKNVKCVVIRGKNKLIFNQIKLPVVMHGVNADCFLFLAFPVPIFSWKKNMVSTIHDICCWDCPDTMNGMSKWYFRLSHRIAIRKCKAIVTISKYSKKRIHKKLNYPNKRIWLVYCGVASESFIRHQDTKAIIKEKYGLPSVYILSLSTLEPRKNLQLLIRAYVALLNQGYSLPKLVLAGRKGWKMDDYLNSLDPNIRDNIIFTGFIDEDDLADVYGCAKLFVFPSMYEGFGLPPLEALVCGTKVLSSDAASLPEVLGRDAEFFSSCDFESLKKELLRCCLDEDEIGLDKRSEIRMRIINSFSWEKEADKLHDLLCREFG